VFGGIAVLTTHKHWTKTTDKVKPISEPLTEWINSMDPGTVEMLQKYMLPMSVFTGIVAVATPDVMVELEFRKLKRQAMMGGILIPPPTPPAQPSAAQGPTNGNGAVVTSPVGDTGVVTAVLEDI